MTQPAVSLQIKALEEQLGVKLFERVNNKLTLTSIGQALSPCATEILHAEADALQLLEELKGISKGKLVVGTNTTGGMYVLPPILRAFKEEHPGFDITLQIDATDRITERVAQNVIDVGFVGGPIRDSRFTVESIFQDELVIIASPSHPAALMSNIGLEDLAEYPFILPEVGSRTRMLVERAFRDANVIMQPKMQLIGTEAVKKAVEANLGVAAVSRYSVLREVHLGILKILELSDRRLLRPLDMLYRKGKYFSPAADEFMKFVRDYTRTRLPAALNQIQSLAAGGTDPN